MVYIVTKNRKNMLLICFRNQHSHLLGTLACQWQMQGAHVNASNARMIMRATLACNIRMNAIEDRRKAIRQVRAAGVLLHASRGGETSDM